MLNEEKIKKLVVEELSKNDVRGIINDKFASLMKDSDFKKEVRAIAVDVIDDFFNEMYTRKGFWKSGLKR